MQRFAPRCPNPVRVNCRVIRLPQMVHTSHKHISSALLNQPGTSVLEAVAPSSSAARSLFDVAQDINGLEGEDAEKLRRIFRVTCGTASCAVGPELSAKYKMVQDNRQLVVSVTNKWTLEQAWFNEVRSRKPQTFVAGGRPTDPTGGGGPGRCDFCDWEKLTACDPWGRIESHHAVTASNLFKYGEPYHGLALLKSHDPLTFSLEQLSDLMHVSAGWFEAAERHYQAATADQLPLAALPSPGTSHSQAYHQPAQGALHPFFIWNALARAGASQYHAHAQLMSTCVPVPAQAQLDLQAARYAAQFPGSDYVRDLLKAHRAVGLLRACAATPQEAADMRAAGDQPTSKRRRAWVAASLSPIKDMEMMVAVEAGCHTCDNRGVAVDSEARVGLADPAFCRALHAALRALTDTMGIESFNVGILNVPCATAPAASSSPVQSGGSTAPGAVSPQPRMVLARVVSRGRMSQPASDFGCLEVVGGASIGHTDPYKVIAAVEQQLRDCLIDASLLL